MTFVDAAPRSLITDPEQVAEAARALAAGGDVAHAFANFYAITTRGDADSVRRVNRMKGRPADQVGSVTGPPSTLLRAWDLDRLPDALPAEVALAVVDTLFALGPFGFRGPAAAHVPAQLSQVDHDVRTAQVIAPGYRCPSNALLAAACRDLGEDLLSITSANRSRQLTGAEDSPAHWRAAGVRADFGDGPGGVGSGLLLVEHADEGAARAAYPDHLPMSTTVLGLHRVVRVPGDPRPHLVLERHGSLPATVVRRVLADVGFGLVLGPRAATRLQPRHYPEPSVDR